MDYYATFPVFSYHYYPMRGMNAYAIYMSVILANSCILQTLLK